MLNKSTRNRSWNCHPVRSANRYFPSLTPTTGVHIYPLARSEVTASFRGKRLERTVTGMARPVAESSLKSEFNAFLFAPIGKNSDGMQVSVLSGLAQSELDPWAEAAELALLPVKNAVERLALLIGKMPDKGWAYPEPVAVATRLIALLPKQFSESGATAVPTIRGLMSSKPWWVYVAVMAVVLGSQFLIASHQVPQKTGNTETKDSSSVAPQVPPSNSSH